VVRAKYANPRWSANTFAHPIQTLPPRDSATFRAITSPRGELFLASIRARAVRNISKTRPWFWVRSEPAAPSNREERSVGLGSFSALVDLGSVSEANDR